MKIRIPKIRPLFAALLASAALTQTLPAGTHTWSGTGFFGPSLVWSDPFNWSEGVVPASGESNLVLVFPPGTNTYVTNDIAGLVVEQIQISGTNYLLQGLGGGNSLTIRGSGPLFADFQITGASNTVAASLGLVLSNTVSFTVPTNKTFTVKSIMSGPGGVDKAGTGTLAMQTAGFNNTYAGDTTVRGGLLLLANGNALGVPGDLTIGTAGGTTPCEVKYGNHFAVGNGVVTVYTNGVFNLWGFNDTIGSLRLFGGEANTAGGTLGLNGDITTTGYPQLYGIVGLGALTRTINAIDGGLYADVTFSTTFPGVGLNKTGAGYVSLMSTNEFDGLVTVATGTLFVGHSGALGTTNSGTIVSNGAAINLNSFVSVTGEALTVQGSGDPSWGAFGFGTGANWNGNVSLPADTIVDVLSDSAPSSIAGTITGAGKLIKTGIGTLVLGGTSFNSNTGGAEVWEGGLALDKPQNQFAVVNSLIIGATNSLPNTAWATLFAGNQISDFATVNIRSNGLLNTANNYETIGALIGQGQVNIGTSQFWVGSGNISSTFDGKLTGNGTTNLVKTGTGTFTLTGTSTVTGPTLVDEGTLLVNGSMANSPFIVINGGTLGGDGTVNSVTVEAGGTLAPGASPGQLAISGALTMKVGSTYAVELNGLQAGSTYDQILVGGAVDLGNATLSLSLGVPTVVSNFWVIVSKANAGAITGTFNSLPQNSIITAGNRKFRVSYIGGNGNDVQLTQENSVPQLQTLVVPDAWPEGSPMTLSGTYLEGDNGDTVKLVVAWGDGSTTTNDVSGGAFSLNHTYTDDNPTGSTMDVYNVAAYPFDNHGGAGPTIGRTPVITNVQPTFSPTTAASVPSGQPFTRNVTISDPGTDTFVGFVNTPPSLVLK